MQIAQAGGLQRPGHRHLVKCDLRMPLQIEHTQRMHCILMRATNGDDADGRVITAEHQAIEPVGTRPGERCRDPLLHHTTFELRAIRRELHRRIVIQTMRRQRKVWRDKRARRRHHQRGRLFSRLRGGLQCDPQSREPRERDAGKTQVQHVRGRCRVQHRDEHALEYMLGLMRIGRRMRAVIVARHRQHAAMLRGAGKIAAVQRVACAIHAWSFAVPHAEHAIDALAGKRIELLRPVQHGRGEVLVHARLELDVPLGQHLLPPPQFLIQAAQRRSAITRHKSAGIQSRQAVQPRLLQQHPHQCLDAGQQCRLVQIVEPAFQRGGGSTEADVHLGVAPRYGGVKFPEVLRLARTILPCEAKARTGSWRNSREAACCVVMATTCCRSRWMKRTYYCAAIRGRACISGAREALRSPSSSQTIRTVVGKFAGSSQNTSFSNRANRSGGRIVGRDGTRTAEPTSCSPGAPSRASNSIAA